MAKIYQFPQGEERAKFRKEIARERKKRFAVKTGSTFVKWLGWGWFYLRLLAASVLHFIFVFVLAILVAGGYFVCHHLVSSRSPVMDATKSDYTGDYGNLDFGTAG